MISPRSIGPFEAYGVELEYMIVNRHTLSIMPIADHVLKTHNGQPRGEVQKGDLGWSNELAAHLVELKTARPSPALIQLHHVFHKGITRINSKLSKADAILMPGGAHPWMNPSKETYIWPHENNDIYEAFHRIFNCRNHGWVNLQSCHFNLPFHTNDDFGRLHAAIRVLLPLLPALAASSPFLEGRRTGWLDARLREYRRNCRRVPSITAAVVPEPVFTPAEYRSAILEPMYRDIAPFDPDRILRHEWLNARGAIARFDRKTIEIRILDVQECPLADLAILQFIAATLKSLIQEKWSSWSFQKSMRTRPLATLLMAAARYGGSAEITMAAFPRVFGLRSAKTVRPVLEHLAEQISSELDAESRKALEVILSRGTLAERLLRAAGRSGAAKLRDVYRELCTCLAANTQFTP